MAQLEIIRDGCGYQLTDQTLDFPQGLVQQFTALLLSRGNAFGNLINGLSVGLTQSRLSSSLRSGVRDCRNQLAAAYGLEISSEISDYGIDGNNLWADIELTVDGVGLSAPIFIGF